MEAKSVEAQSRRWGLPCATDAPTLLCIVLYVPHACNTWVTRYNIADDEDEGDYDDDDAPFASCKAPMVAGGGGEVMANWFNHIISYAPFVYIQHVLFHLATVVNVLYQSCCDADRYGPQNLTCGILGPRHATCL